MFTPEEVAVHNNADDCWVTVFDKVFDLTELIAENRGVLADPVIKCAGSSISHWFDQQSGDVKMYMDPMRNIVIPYTPQGRFIHVPPPDPSDSYVIIETPWWLDLRYIVGKVWITCHANALFMFLLTNPQLICYLPFVLSFSLLIALE